MELMLFGGVFTGIFAGALAFLPGFVLDISHLLTRA